MAAPASAYAVLGLSPTASKIEVKEAFRKLVWKHHPDKAAPEMRATAEAAFKEIKTAYETILKGQAGYAPPPPGSAPNAAYAEAYWHAHTSDGRVPWGKYAGYETESQFYRAWLRSGRNSLVALSIAGLLAIPTISTAIMIWQRDEESQWSHVREQGLDVLRQQHRVNGQVTFNSPFAAADQLDTLAARKREAAARAAQHAAQQQQQQ